MKITVIISVLLITQVSASFYDMVQGAMDSSFGKIMTDVAIDVKDSMSCTVLAMKHALSISENATASYNEQCKAETDKNTVSDTKPEGTAGKVQLIIEFMDQGKVNEENKGEFDAKVIEAVAKLMQQYNNQDKLASVEAAMAKETKMLESINDLLKEELKLLPKQDLNNSLHNDTKPSIDSILDKIKLLEDYERNTKNSSEATKIHKIIGEVLDKLNSISSNEAVENLKLDEILSDLEKQSNKTLPDLRQTFENWKDEKAKHLNKVQIEIEKHESLNNNTKPTNTTKIIPIVDHNEIDMSSTVPSAVLSQPVNVTKSAKESAIMVVVDEHSVPMRKNNSDYDKTNSTLPISVTNNTSTESKNSESPSEQTLTKITINPQNMTTTTVTVLNRDSNTFNSSSTPVTVTESTRVSSTVVASDKITVPLHKDNSNNNIVNSTTPIFLINNISTDSNKSKLTTTEHTSAMTTIALNITSTTSPSTVLKKDSYNFTKSSTPVIITESTTVSSTVNNSSHNIVNSTTPISLINNTSTESTNSEPTMFEQSSEKTTSAQNITSTSPSTVLNNGSYNLTLSSTPVVVTESTTVSSMVVPSDKLTVPMQKDNSNNDTINSTTPISLINNTSTESTNSKPTTSEHASEMTTSAQNITSTSPSTVLNNDSYNLTRSSTPFIVTESTTVSSTVVVSEKLTGLMHKNNSNNDTINSTTPISLINNTSTESTNSKPTTSEHASEMTTSAQNITSTSPGTVLNNDSYNLTRSSTPFIVTVSTTMSSTVVVSEKLTGLMHKNNSNHNIDNSTTPISLVNNTSTESTNSEPTMFEQSSEMTTSAQNITSTSPSTVLNNDSYNLTLSSTPVVVTESTTVSSMVVPSDKLTVPMQKDNSNNDTINSTTPISLINNTSTESTNSKPTTSEHASEMTTSAQNITSTSPSTVLNNDSYNLTRSSTPFIVTESTTVSSTVVVSEKLTGLMHKNNSNHNIDNSTTPISLVNNTSTESTNSEPTMFEQSSEMTTSAQNITSTSPSTVLNNDSYNLTRSSTPVIVKESTTVSSTVAASEKLTGPMRKNNSNHNIDNSTTPISLVNNTSTESTNSKPTTSEHTSEMTTRAQNIPSTSPSTVLNNDSYNLTRSSTPFIVTESTTVSSTVVVSEKLTGLMHKNNSNHNIDNSTTPISLVNNTSTESTESQPTMFEQTSEMTSAQNITSTTSPSTVLNTDSYTFTKSSTPGIVTESTTVSSMVVASDKLTGPMHKNNSNYDIINSTTPISIINNTSTERIKTSDEMTTSAQNITSTTGPSTVLNSDGYNFTRSSTPGIVTESTTVSSTVTASYEHIVPIHKDNSNNDVINSTTHISLINMSLIERDNSRATSATTSDEITTSAQNMTSTTGPSTVLNTFSDNFNKSSTPVLLIETTTKYLTVVASDEHTEPMHKVNSNYDMNSTTPISVINNTLTDNENYKVDVTTSIPFSKTTGLQDNTTNSSVLSPLYITRVNMNHNNNSEYNDDNINNTSNIIESRDVNLLDILSRSTLAPAFATKHVTSTPSPLNYVDIIGENTKKSSLLANTSLNPGSVINKIPSGNHSEITATPISHNETTTIYYSDNNANSFNESLTTPTTSTQENGTVITTDIIDIERSTDISTVPVPFEPVTIIPEPVTAVQVTGREEENSELTKMTSDDGGNIILDTTTVKISQFTDVFSSPNMIDTKEVADQVTSNILTNIDSNKSNMITATSVSVTETTDSADTEPLYEYTTSVFNNLISSTNTNSNKPTNTDLDVENDLTSVIEETETSTSVSNHFRLSTTTDYPSSQAFEIPMNLNDIATTENNQEQIWPQSGEENNNNLWPLDQTKSSVAENKPQTQVKKPAKALNTFEASLKKMFNVPSPKATKKPISEIENFMNSFLSNIDIPLKTKPEIPSKDITTTKAVNLFKSLEAHSSINSIDFNSLSDEPSTRRDTRAATHSPLKQSAQQREIEEARKLIEDSNRQRHVIDSIEEKGTDARSVFGH